MSKVDVLLKAFDNENNEFILQHNSKDIRKKKLNILKEIHLEDEKIEEFMNKLEDYIYIDEMQEVISGSFIRWIPLKDPENIKLTKGATVCDLNLCNKGCLIICKNFRNTHMQIKIEECLIFRKMTEQEKVLLSAMNYLTK
tara:strand:+ start:905 stop:1327 length:423 start_codon:yes stop_codon:yes gene_type:complete